jgi:CRP-like cAMP-binding protein
VKLEERTGALAQASLFKGLPNSALREIARSTQIQTLASGGSLPLPPARLAWLFLIVSGSVNLSLLSASGRQFVVTIAGRGEILGELSNSNPVGSERTSPTLIAVAQEPTCILRIPWHTLRQSIASTELAQRCNALLAERAAWMLAVIQDLALYPLDARLARLLARMQERSSAHAAARLNRLDQGTLALMANGTRPKVNQHLQRLQQLGAIRLDHGAVRVCNSALLEQLGEHD